MNASGEAAQTALLLAAHGERRPGADNATAFRLALALADRGLVSETAVGFIKGLPSIGDAIASLMARRIIVYPLFAASGYFTRDRLVQLLDEADRQGRAVQILPPLGLDPGLPDVLVRLVHNTIRKYGMEARTSTVICLAHGSRRSSASREATEQIARAVEKRGVFREIRSAFLEQRPSLHEVAGLVAGPAIVVGMFSSEGMHGAGDAPRLTAELGRNDIVFAGVIGGAPGIEDMVARSVAKALSRDATSQRSGEVA